MKVRRAAVRIFALSCLSIAFGAPLFGNQVTLPGSVQCSGAGRDSEPAAAFNTVNGTWLVVWREAFADNPNNFQVQGRIVRQDRSFATPVFTIGAIIGPARPRVAHDPLRNEWMVVFGSAPFFDDGPFRILARKVASNGTLIGDSARVLSSGTGEAFPDVAAGKSVSLLVPQSPIPIFMVVWQENFAGQPGIVALRTFDDAAQPGRIGITGTPFRVDTDASLPAVRRSTNPRITEFGPGISGSGLVGRTTQETYHRIVFEVESNGQKDIWLAGINFSTVRATLRITDTIANETAPVVAYNSVSRRDAIVFERAGGGVRAQLMGLSSASPFLELVGGDFTVSPGTAPTVVAQPGSDIFFVSATDANRLGLGCIAGQRVVGTPSVGTGTISTQPVVSPSSAGGVLLGFTRTEANGTKLIRASVVDPLAVVPNNPPVARAGADLEVAEDTLFSLDGSTSSDPNGDPLRFLWSRTDGGNPDDFFVDGAQRTLAKPQLRAPALGPDLQPINLIFQVAVDDYRIDPAFGPTDTVVVRVVPGADAHPPIARAGADRTVDENQSVQLDGSASSDPDDDPLTFSWTLLSVTPPLVPPASVVVTGASTAKPSFTTPRFANQNGIDLRFRLAVTTPRGGRGEDEVIVHVRDTINEAPLADAGADLTGAAAVNEGTPFALDGSASSDPNGDTLTYRWELVGTLSFNGNLRETLDMTGGDTPTPSITVALFNERTLVFRLTVTDPDGLEATDEVSVRVKMVPMSITSISPLAGSPGTRVTIRGINFASPDTRVFFGPTDLLHQGRIEFLSDSEIRVLVPGGGPTQLRVLPINSKMRSIIASDYHEITTGRITVRNGSDQVQSAQDFQVSHVEIYDAYLSQGIEGYPLVQGKTTLLQIRVRTKEASAATLAGLSQGTCTVFPKDQPTFQIEAANVPSSALALTAKVTRMSEAVNFHIDGANVHASSYRFNLQLFHNGIEVAALRTEADSGPFTATRIPRILAVRVVPYQNGSVSFSDTGRQTMLDRIDRSLAAFRRIYPLSGAEIVQWPDEVEMSDIVADDGKIHLQQFDFSSTAFIDQLQAFNSLADILNTWNADHPDQRALFVVGFIANELYGGEASGIGNPPLAMVSDIVKFWAEENLPVIGEVLTTVLGFVGDVACTLTLGTFCEDPVDILIDIVVDTFVAFGFDITGNLSFVFTNSSAGATLAQELGHNLGFVNPYEPEHDASNISHSLYDEDGGLTFFSVPGVFGPVFNVLPGEASLFNGTNLPKSAMSYAPNASNSNTFFEPKHYRRIFDAFRLDANLKRLQAADGRGAGLPTGPALRLIGAYMFSEGVAVVREARLAMPSEVPTPDEPKSPFRLAFLGAAGQLLAEKGVTFNVSAPIHTHGDDGSDGEIHDVAAIFYTIEEIPNGTARAELSYDGTVVWSRSALGVSPTLDLVAPQGGETVQPGAELRIRWLSVDSDGDDVTQTIYFSLDGGATFAPLALAVRGTEYRWSTEATAGSDHAVIKIVASDGFHSTEVQSGEFILGGGSPVASILAPSAGDKIVSSHPLSLRGTARAPGGTEFSVPEAFHWSSSVDGDLGTGNSITRGPLSVGNHTLRLEVDVDGVMATTELLIDVLPDRDGDGVDDATETENGLDPDDPDDVFRDEDGDGVTTGAEILDVGSNPDQADSDGDGIPDGVEVENHTSPISRDTDGDGSEDDTDNCALVPNSDQADADEDGIGDACDEDTVPAAGVFRRGDSNGDGRTDISDAVGTLSFLFTGGASPVCDDAADSNDDGSVDISDALTTLGFLFLGGKTPPAPGPTACGVDPTADELEACAYPAETCAP